MRRLACAVAFYFSWVCGLAPFFIADAVAAEKLNILVMGEDAEEVGTGTQITVVRRDTRVFKQVLEAITEGLEQDGFNVFDERAVTLDHFKQDRTGRAEAELIDIARSVQKPPIDAVVMFTAYAGAKKLAYTTDIFARVTARILDVKTGRKLGSFEVQSPSGSKAHIGCERDCLIEVIGKATRALGADIGKLAGQKLITVARATKDTAPPRAPSTSASSNLPGGYTLKFTGFTQDDITAVEEYLVAFEGYKLHRPMTMSGQTAGYWYEIDSDSARMNRNLRMMLERIGVDGKITFAARDNTFHVEKSEPARQPVAEAARP
jgi:hypothetical protein